MLLYVRTVYVGWRKITAFFFYRKSLNRNKKLIFENIFGKGLRFTYEKRTCIIYSIFKY